MTNKEPIMDGSKLCQTSTGQEDDWTKLYESAFPADERSPIEDLRKLISSGSMLLHKTVNKDGELLCFSLVNVMSNFVLLAYIATDTTKRSSGVGSKHMKQLVQTLRAQYPTFTALFLEIESTKESGLDAEILKMRLRRLAFYQRLGAKRLKQKYGMPSYAQKGSKAQGELLWIELTNSCVFDSDLPNVITEIFLKGYGLLSTDPIVQTIVAQWASSMPASGPTCAIPEVPITLSSTSGASTAATDPLASTNTGTPTTKNADVPATTDATVTKDADKPATKDAQPEEKLPTVPPTSDNPAPAV
jgi:hypothetical protein